MRISGKTFRRSALAAIIIAIQGMAVQVALSRLASGGGPPQAGRIAGLAACYLVMAFAYALGYFLIEDRIPGRGWIEKGLSYSALVLISVWISGFINMFAIDFEGGCNLLSPAKIIVYRMMPVDCLNLMVGGLELGFIARKDVKKTALAVHFSENLAGRIAAGTVAFPVLCAASFALASLALPSGYDLSGERGWIFYLFLFVPLAISGTGTALFHDALRPERGRGVFDGSLRIALFMFILYWATNVVFVLFFGFTWQTTVDFLAAVAVSLFFTVAVLEKIARLPPKAAASRP